MMNQYPGGQHFSIVQEHDKLYRQKKDFAIASIEQKRRSEKLALREHAQNLSKQINQIIAQSKTPGNISDDQSNSDLVKVKLAKQN